MDDCSGAPGCTKAIYADERCRDHWDSVVQYRNRMVRCGRCKGEFAYGVRHTCSEPQPVDMVNSPSHYKRGGIECIDVCDAFDLDRYDAPVIQYVLRAKFKGSEITDLEKAHWYLTRKIARLKRAAEEEKA